VAPLWARGASASGRRCFSGLAVGVRMPMTPTNPSPRQAEAAGQEVVPGPCAPAEKAPLRPPAEAREAGHRAGGSSGWAALGMAGPHRYRAAYGPADSGPAAARWVGWGARQQAGFGPVAVLLLAEEVPVVLSPGAGARARAGRLVSAIRWLQGPRVLVGQEVAGDKGSPGPLAVRDWQGQAGPGSPARDSPWRGNARSPRADQWPQLSAT
jgi:hypothetical protein